MQFNDFKVYKGEQMKSTFLSRIALLVCGVMGIAFCVHAYSPKYRFSVTGNKIYINSVEFKAKGLRFSNALVSDAKTDSLIMYLDTFKLYGINSFSVFWMGSRFGNINGFLPDASLNPVYTPRMKRIIEAADARGMIMMIGVLYWGGSTAKDALVAAGWGQTQANAAAINVLNWLHQYTYQNVFMDLDNEHMAQDNAVCNDVALIAAVKAADTFSTGKIMIASQSATIPTQADLDIHFGAKETGKPYIETEGVDANPPYWTTYSKDASFPNNYIRIGLYTAAMKTLLESNTTNMINTNNGWFTASTWIQAGPGAGIGGPFQTPGGYSNYTDAEVNANFAVVKPDAGIRWYLEWLKTQYGAWTPPPPMTTAVLLAPLSIKPAAGFDELKIFDFGGRLVERFTFKSEMPFENMPRIKHTGSYLALFSNEGTVVNIKRICNLSH
jgi:hypothetical protein